MQVHLNSHVRSILEKCKHLNHLKQLQAHLITLGYAQAQFYAFKLVRFCTINISNLPYARLIFDHLQCPNVYLYTAIITAYNEVSEYASSVGIYREMIRGKRSTPNQFLYPMVVKACSEVVKPFGTELVHAQIEKCGFGEHPVVETALLDCYSRYCVDIGIARKLFDRIAERSVVTWTAMISGYTRVGMVGDAVLLFEEMPDWQRDTPFWNSIIAGFTQNGLFLEAISFFRRMVFSSKGNNNEPNQVTVVCALSACGHGGMLQLGKCIHGYVYRNGIGMVSYLANGLVDMYGKCGSFKEASLVFNTTTNKNLTSWNSMINCYALHGKTRYAITTFEEMQKHKDEVKPDEVTFIGLLNACAHGGLVDQGRRFYDLMKEYQIQPDITHNGCLIDLLGRAGQLEEALEVINHMNTPPDEIMWGSLLNACKIHKRTDLAEAVVKKLIEIDPYNGGYVSMLANLYSEIGKWDEVQNVRKSLKENNAHKTPGCSWIDIDNVLNQFSSFDTSHPRTKEIYSVLETLIDSS